MKLIVLLVLKRVLMTIRLSCLLCANRLCGLMLRRVVCVRRCLIRRLLKVAGRRCLGVGVRIFLCGTRLIVMVLRLFLVVWNTVRRERLLTTCNVRLIVTNRLIRFRVVMLIRLIALLIRRLVARASVRLMTFVNWFVLRSRVARVMRPFRWLKHLGYWYEMYFDSVVYFCSVAAFDSSDWFDFGVGSAARRVAP